MFSYCLAGVLWGLYAGMMQSILFPKSTGSKIIITGIVNCIGWPIGMWMAYRTAEDYHGQSD